jgi:hypothetical protein
MQRHGYRQPQGVASNRVLVAILMLEKVRAPRGYTKKVRPHLVLLVLRRLAIISHGCRSSLRHAPPAAAGDHSTRRALTLSKSLRASRVGIGRAATVEAADSGAMFPSRTRIAPARRAARRIWRATPQERRFNPSRGSL